MGVRGSPGLGKSAPRDMDINEEARLVEINDGGWTADVKIDRRTNKVESYKGIER